MKDKNRSRLISYNMKKIALQESVQKRFDTDLSELILKTIRYPLDTYFVDLPSKQNFYSNEAEDDRVWLWAGFIPPGIAQFTVNDPLNGQSDKTLLITPRINDLNPNVFDPLVGEEQEESTSAF